MVFSGLYPVDTREYTSLRDALEKLTLNDASLAYEPEESAALGPGFRCGFLGLLHMDIVQERLEREYGLDLITTSPSVEYRVNLRNGGLAAGGEADGPAARRRDRVDRGAVAGPDDNHAGHVHRGGDGAGDRSIEGSIRRWST